MFTKKLALSLVLVLALAGCSSTTQKDISPNNSNTKPKQNTSNTSNGSSSPSTTGNEPSVQSKPFTPTILTSIANLSKKTIAWSWLYSPRDNAALLAKYHGYAFGDTTKKIIYLTFDEGYENGYTGSILDTLKANNVKAAFFVTEPYVTGSFNGVPDIALVKRMMNEGHIIGNHSVNHKSMPSITEEAAFDYEITGNEKTVDSIPGLKMSKFFRPPMGDFSELSLYYTQKLGYKSIFFGLAHDDYTPTKQPDPVTAKANLLKETKPGMICLLHALSKTNATILDSLIKEWKSEGYEFKTLNDLP